MMLEAPECSSFYKASPVVVVDSISVAFDPFKFGGIAIGGAVIHFHVLMYFILV